MTFQSNCVRRLVLAASALAMLASCAPARATVAVAAAVTPPPCLGAATMIAWANLAEDAHRRALDDWCGSVGAPVVSPTPAVPDGSVRRLLVLSWNVHVGSGQVPQLVATLRQMLESRGAGETGIVLLLQEMFRTGEAVPSQWAGMFAVPGRIAPHRATPEVGALARELGMSVAYVPSMRNGGSPLAEHREDRGSAILSTEPLSDITAIELPMLKQRRIVVMATVAPRGGHVAPLRVMTTHLDTLGPRGAQAKALASYIAQLPSDTPLVMGGDLNALWGVGDQTVRTLSRVMTMERCGDRRTHLLGRFDYIFTRLDRGTSRTCQTLDDKYSSDHRPLLLTLH